VDEEAEAVADEAGHQEGGNGVLRDLAGGIVAVPPPNSLPESVPY